MKGSANPLRARLFADETLEVYAVLDGASIPGLLDEFHTRQPERECLFRGDLKPDVAETAPYLVHLPQQSEFTDWVLRQGWGKHWGIFALSGAGFREMRQHLRRLMIVHDADGHPMYFRFYDPRVLRLYLPSCNAEELETVFGPVMAFLLEDEDPAGMLRFTVTGGALVKKEQKLAPM